MPEYRRGKPNARYTTTADSGALVRLRTDANGVVEVTSEAERRAADALRLVPTKSKKPTTEEVTGDGR